MAEMIEFVFRGDASDLASALKDVTGGLEDAGKQAEEVGEKSEQGFNRTIKVSKGAKVAIGAVSGAFVAAGAAAVKMARDTLKLADRINRIAKEAKEAGTTAEEFQKLEGALGLLTKGGVSAANTAKFLQRNIADARDGSKEAGDAFAKLGLEGESLSRFALLPLTDQVAEVGDRISQMDDKTQQAQVALKLFERGGSALLPAFRAGGDAVRDAAAQIEDAGILSNKAAAQAEGLADAVDLLTRKVQTIKDQALVPLIPTFTAFAGALQQTLQPMTQTGNSGAEMARIFREVVAPALVVVAVEGRKGLSGLAVTAKAMVVAFQRVKVTFLTLTGQFRKAEAAISDLQASEAELDKATAEFVQTQADADEAGQRFLETLGDLENQARRTGDAMTDVAPSAVGGGTAGSRVAAAIPGAAPGIGSIVDGDFDADGQMTRSESFRAQIDTMVDDVLSGLKPIDQALEDAKKALEDHLRELADRQRERAEQFATITAGVTDSMRSLAQTQGQAIVAIARAATDAEIAQTKRGTKAREEAAKKAFRINKAAALVNAGINTALAVTNAAATQPFIPLGIIAMAAAAAAGAVQIGIIAAKQPPQFHRGGVLSQGAADEITVRARAGEGFLSNQGVAAAGGAEGVARLNRGGRSGPDAVYVVNRVGSRMIDVQTTNAIRRTDSPLSSAIRSARPRSVGRYDPFAKV